MQIYNNKRTKALNTGPSRDTLNQKSSRQISNSEQMKRQLESENAELRSKIEEMEGGISRSNMGSNNNMGTNMSQSNRMGVEMEGLGNKSYLSSEIM